MNERTPSPLSMASASLGPHRIFTVRGRRVILDSDLAKLYCMPTKRLNEQDEDGVPWQLIEVAGKMNAPIDDEERIGQCPRCEAVIPCGAGTVESAWP